MATTFENKCAILADLWLNYKDNEELEDFVEYNDLGLPLAFLIDSELVTHTEIAKKYIEETWVMLLLSLNIKEDIGFTSLPDLFSHAEED